MIQIHNTNMAGPTLPTVAGEKKIKLKLCPVRWKLSVFLKAVGVELLLSRNGCIYSLNRSYYIDAVYCHCSYCPALHDSVELIIITWVLNALFVLCNAAQSTRCSVKIATSFKRSVWIFCLHLSPSRRGDKTRQPGPDERKPSALRV